jgi:hypothetical protein
MDVVNSIFVSISIPSVMISSDQPLPVTQPFRAESSGLKPWVTELTLRVRL